MALHRDIFWLGRQWAVTGSGMQAINQKYNGQFDIPIERLWDDDLLDGVRDQTWFNPDDFNKGLAVARERHKRPPLQAVPPLPVEALLRESDAAAPAQVVPSPGIATAQSPGSAAAELQPTSKPAPSFFRMSIISHPARLLRVWRARRRR